MDFAFIQQQKLEKRKKAFSGRSRERHRGREREQDRPGKEGTHRDEILGEQHDRPL